MSYFPPSSHLLSAGLLLLAASIHLHAAVPEDERLHRPAGEQLDAAAMQAAMDDAVTNGIATLWMRLEDPENDSGLVFPPLKQRKVVDYKERTVEERWAIKDVKQPVWEYEEVDRLVPKRDEYGDIVGYEKKKVKVKARIKEYKTVQREVRDPNGDIVKKRTHRSPIFGPGGPDIIPRGLFGLNGMALYIMCEAGLKEDRHTRDFARRLRTALDKYGLPDHTWDLAWLTAAYIALDDKYSEKMRDALISRMVDGQFRQDGDGEGLWGPICIHYGVLARFFEIELILRQERDKIAAEGEPTNAAKKKQWMDKQRKLTKALNEVTHGLSMNSQQGKRLLEITKTWKFDEETHLSGLPIYIYNKHLSDLDSTAMAAFAIRLAHDKELLPKETLRIKPAGHTLARPERVDSTLKEAITALSRVQRKDGSWSPVNSLDVNRAFDKLKAVILDQVPFKGALPELTKPLSWRTDINGHAAYCDLLYLNPRYRNKYNRGYESSRTRVEAIAEALLAGPLVTNDRKTDVRRPYAGDTMTHDALIAAKGQLPVGKMEDIAVADAPQAYNALPAELLPGLMALFRNGESSELNTEDPLYRQLCYRLLITQDAHGQWGSMRMRNQSYSSAEYAYSLQKSASRIYDQSVARQGRKPKNPRDFSYSHQIESLHRAKTNQAPEELFQTLHSLHLLVAGLDQPIDMSEVTILPPPPSAEELAAAGTDGEGDAAKKEQNQREVDTQKAIRDLIASVNRPNDALADVWAKILAHHGEELQVPEKATDATGPAETSDEIAKDGEDKDLREAVDDAVKDLLGGE